MAASYSIKRLVCSHHVYKAVWSHYIGEEEPLVQCKVANIQDDFAVAILKTWSLATCHKKYPESGGSSAEKR